MVLGGQVLWKGLWRGIGMASNTLYTSGTHSIAFVTVPNETVGKTLAKGLVKDKLAACVNIIPAITSVFEWENKIEEDSESMLIIKTRATRLDEVTEFVRKHHPYEVPEVISMPIENGNPSYLEWLGKIVGEKH